MINELATLPNS